MYNINLLGPENTDTKDFEQAQFMLHLSPYCYLGCQQIPELTYSPELTYR